MTRLLNGLLYDARGNRYVVSTPQTIGTDDRDVKALAATCQDWAAEAIRTQCHPAGEVEPISDGLIVGPFENAAPFNALIVNTDGSLAERSGNGLTIFAQALRDAGMVKANDRFDVSVHHATPDQPSPVMATLSITDLDGVPGVWVAMGQPAFGPHAVDASAAIAATGTPRRDTNHISELAAVHERWTDSVLVRIGNPHCVTWLSDVEELPAFEALGTTPWYDSLKRIAFAPMADGGQTTGPTPSDFAHGINLQWAVRLENDRIAARIFERGEGPTRSSGSSATAVACSGRQLGLTTADTVYVEMPGGIATIRFEAAGDEGFTAHYLGVADRVER